MNIQFSTDGDRSQFFRQLRLLQDDLISYAGAAATYVGAKRATTEDVLLAALNENPGFWTAVLSSLQSSAFVSLIRIHDRRKGAYFPKLLLALTQSASPECKAAAKQLGAAVDEHQQFIEKALHLRHSLFAHTDHEAPLAAAFGFKGLTLDMFGAYWRSMAVAVAATELAALGHENYGPKTDVGLFARFEADALRAIGSGPPATFALAVR